ncbi:hypothetical protein LEP1GSC202_2271 [Leptospira yanagawae serovar Saopaulo str. Sao Paulo = ATCC 700523]|uniref:Uncharacterized protein n=1 Tax=Leptospira yanagawae serovar Saopaulo str. Sao Paulo = ATCC 700523 TaxID=1249483 RepID=A0A5E8HAK6_9LEPT|nr:hypothetical protein LEP1GSC202_2271 [Leptospira yanagawae serovar Saopaulo str. Sao Paulo = ATCC 700523]
MGEIRPSWIQKNIIMPYLSEKFVKNKKKLAKNEQWFFIHPTFPVKSTK